MKIKINALNTVIVEGSVSDIIKEDNKTKFHIYTSKCSLSVFLDNCLTTNLKEGNYYRIHGKLRYSTRSKKHKVMGSSITQVEKGYMSYAYIEGNIDKDKLELSHYIVDKKDQKVYKLPLNLTLSEGKKDKLKTYQGDIWMIEGNLIWDKVKKEIVMDVKHYQPTDPLVLDI